MAPRIDGPPDIGGCGGIERPAAILEAEIARRRGDMGGDLRDFASLSLGNSREAPLHAGIDLNIVCNPEPRA